MASELAERIAEKLIATWRLQSHFGGYPSFTEVVAVIEGVLAGESGSTSAELEAYNADLQKERRRQDAEIERLRAELAAIDKAVTTLTQWLQDWQSTRKALEGGDGN